MEENERQQADMLRYRLKKILPFLKHAYENAKHLSERYGWDNDYWAMCEAYMNLADEYIGVMEALEEEDGGGAE